MMQHEKTDQAILSRLADVLPAMLEDYADHVRYPLFDTSWQHHRAVQLLTWMSDNIERIKRESQGGVTEHRVPDRLPEDTSRWKQTMMRLPDNIVDD